MGFGTGCGILFLGAALGFSAANFEISEDKAGHNCFGLIKDGYFHKISSWTKGKEEKPWATCFYPKTGQTSDTRLFSPSTDQIAVLSNGKKVDSAFTFTPPTRSGPG